MALRYNNDEEAAQYAQIYARLYQEIETRKAAIATQPLPHPPVASTMSAYSMLQLRVCNAISEVGGDPPALTGWNGSDGVHYMCVRPNTKQRYVEAAEFAPDLEARRHWRIGIMRPYAKAFTRTPHNLHIVMVADCGDDAVGSLIVCASADHVAMLIRRYGWEVL